MHPLTPEEQEKVNAVYARFDVSGGTPKQKSAILQKFIGVREFHCRGESKLSDAEFDEMELRANERIYLLLKT